MEDPGDPVDPRIGFTDSTVEYNQKRKDEPGQGWTPFSSKYMNKKTGTLNKKGVRNLYNLYESNPKFRDEIINFVGNKAGLSNDQIIDKRHKYKTFFNTEG